MNQRIVEIATNLKNFYLESFLKKDNVSIFLCGGSSPTDEKFRRELGTTISTTKSKYRYSVFFPEDMGTSKNYLISLDFMSLLH